MKTDLLTSKILSNCNIDTFLNFQSQLRITCSKSKIEKNWKRWEICSKLTITIPERGHWRRSGVFIVTFPHISTFFWCFYSWLWTSKCWLEWLSCLWDIQETSGEYPEAATRGVLYKKVFLEISQTLQENTCARVSFLIKLQVSGL